MQWPRLQVRPEIEIEEIRFDDIDIRRRRCSQIGREVAIDLDGGQVADT